MQSVDWAKLRAEAVDLGPGEPVPAEPLLSQEEFARMSQAELWEFARQQVALGRLSRQDYEAALQESTDQHLRTLAAMRELQ